MPLSPTQLDRIELDARAGNIHIGDVFMLVESLRCYQLVMSVMVEPARMQEMADRLDEAHSLLVQTRRPE